MTKKRKLETESSEASEPSQKLKQTEDEQLEIKIQEGGDEEVEYEEVEEEHEEEVEDDDDEEDDEDDVGAEAGNRMEAATSGSGNQKDADTDNDEPIQDLLEPFSKEQLLSLLNEAAVKHSDVANRIREVADEDPVHRKIFVHGLGWDTKTETLIEAFKQYGEIEDCKAVFDKVSGKSKGYGFILYKSRSGARNALKQPQKKIGSRMTACQLASKGPVFGGNPVAATASASVVPAQHSNSEHTQKKIYVSNVGAELDPQKLLAFFSKFGEIEEGPLGLDKFTGRPKGFCLFVYKTAESAKRALEEPHKTFEGHVLHCQKAIDGPKPGKPLHQNTHNHNTPRFQRHDNNGYGAPVGHGHLMAANQAGMGGPAQALNPAIGQALTALLASQGAGLAFNPAIGQALLGSLGTATGVNPGAGPGMPAGYGTQAMAPGSIPGYGTTQPGLQGYQTQQPGQGGTGRGQHGVNQYSQYMGH